VRALTLAAKKRGDRHRDCDRGREKAGPTAVTEATKAAATSTVGLLQRELEQVRCNQRIDRSIDLALRAIEAVHELTSRERCRLLKARSHTTNQSTNQKPPVQQIT
jgi:hypothetical protein